MNRRWLVGLVCLGLALALLAGLPAAGLARVARAAPASQNGLAPLGSLLNADGSLDLTSGFIGGLDPAGWRMEYGPDGSPVFKPDSAALAPRSPADTWHALGSGLKGDVCAIAVAGAEVYVGGWFTEAGGNPDADFIARWDGTAWHALGSGLSEYVTAMAVAGPQVYAGGWFTDAAGEANAD
jgi:hypothetical protein